VVTEEDGDTRVIQYGRVQMERYNVHVSTRSALVN
jgi:hypothetical protein